MSEKTIQISGIQRALPQSDSKSGSCQEIINARFRKGCWRPVGKKLMYKAWNLSAYDQVLVHDIENGIVPGEPNYIGYKTSDGTLTLLHAEIETPTVLIETPITRAATPNIEAIIVFLKRTMIVSSESGVEVYLFTDVDDVKSYVRTASLPVPDVLVQRKTSELAGVESDNTQTGEAILGKFYENLNRLSESKGMLYGSIMYMVAYRLFDGSYIMPSIPRYVELSNGGDLKYRNPGGMKQDGTSDNEFRLNFYGYNTESKIDCSKYAGLSATKDLIESICVFYTKATTLHQIDISSLSKEKLDNVYGTTYNSNNHIDTWPFETVFPVVNNEFKELGKSTGWYKVHEFDFEKIVDTPFVLVEEIDTKGFYQDYATRETLTTDQFTHHILSAREAYVYNDRLHLANIKTSPGKPYILWDAPEDWATTLTNDTLPCKISVFLKTTLGKAVVVSNTVIPIFRYKLSEYYSIFIPSVVGYNDSRANKIQITVEQNGVDYLLLSESLVKNETMNFAFWHKKEFSLIHNSLTGRTDNYSKNEIAVSGITNLLSVVNPVDIGLPFDTNRVQVSEIQNPLIFPTKYSYQIGTGSILKLMAGSEPLSTGQFGQFPLQVFTTKGIWAMEIGLGDVLYTNVLPVNGEVAENPKNVIPVGSGVVYSTVKGLFVVNGRQVTELAEIVEGAPATGISGSTEITTLLTDSKFTPGLTGSISDMDFLSYLQNSSVGFDQLNKELVVSNPAKGYSYIFSFESKLWYKISRSFKLLINAYPELLGVTDDNVVSLSKESESEAIEVLIISNCQSLDMPGIFKKLERTDFRSYLLTSGGKTSGFYVFASDDSIKYQLIQGCQRSGIVIDMVTQISPTSAKYYAFVINGSMLPSSEIKQIEILFKNRWNNKLH